MSLQITDQIDRTIGNLEDCLAAMDNVLYSTSSENLSGGTIGQHTRHIIELFTCLLSGYEEGYVNYEKRKRDIVLETDVTAACRALQSIRRSVSLPDKPLQLEVCFEQELSDQISTNYLRELIYNLEHMIHHMALIRVGIRELINLNLPDHFGVAPSTLKHRKEVCAP